MLNGLNKLIFIWFYIFFKIQCIWFDFYFDFIKKIKRITESTNYITFFAHFYSITFYFLKIKLHDF